jgi:hypothetical protein
MEGIFLQQRLRRRDAMVHAEVVAFYDRMNDLDDIRRLLE